MRKFSSKEFNFSRLKTVLSNSGFQQKNNPLFQTISSLIDGGNFVEEQLNNKLDKDSKINLTNQVDSILPLKNGGTFSDQYTPIITLIANCSGVGVDYLYYYQCGVVVTVTGRFQITPTAVGVNTEFAFALPIISYFDFFYECAGSGYSPTINQGAAILADVGNNRAKMQFISVNNIQFDAFFTFAYKIVAK